MFEQEHRDAIGFLAGRAPRAPDVEYALGSALPHEHGDNESTQRFEGLHIAEESRSWVTIASTTLILRGMKVSVWDDPQNVVA